MRPINICRLLLIITLLSVFVGCKESPLEFSVRYDTLGELKSGAPVYFEKTQIGQVGKIVSTDQGDYLVKVSISPEYKGKATENSKFFILEDPLDAHQDALIVEQELQGGAILKDGSIVQGEKRQSCFDALMTRFKKSTQEASLKLQEAMQDLKESLAEGSHDLNEQLQESLNDIDRYFQDYDNSKDPTLNEEELGDLDRALNDFIEEFKRANEDIQKQLREEVLPQLRRNLENLQKQLKDEERKDDAQKIEGQLDQLIRV